MTDDLLVTVRIETLLGAIYVFSDVAPELMAGLIANIDRYRQLSSLTLMNVSEVVLLLPWRIVAKISVGEETLWTSPA